MRDISGQLPSARKQATTTPDTAIRFIFYLLLLLLRVGLLEPRDREIYYSYARGKFQWCRLMLIFIGLMDTSRSRYRPLRSLRAGPALPREPRADERSFGLRNGN
ncbi:unnamed protein product [Trichogramma brassicae]|uniref:Uncharacterized protein n=1 Tax=Trichogramma brassicae TaxID=86971 RepID=A0A6H5JAA1_9HYME|nr:unnamed protein product [Trichogramma brassicae]